MTLAIAILFALAGLWLLADEAARRPRPRDWDAHVEQALEQARQRHPSRRTW